MPYSAEKIRTLQQEFNSRSCVLRYSINEDHVYLDHITSMGKGSGTLAMRALVELSLASGFDGNVRVEAGYSSHLFYLLMGMVPEERVSLPYVEYKYGRKERFALSNFLTENKQDEQTINMLKKILSAEKKIALEKITIEYIEQNRPLLTTLLNTPPVSCIPRYFTEQLIGALHKYKTDKRTSTAYWWGVAMSLSDEGKKRWKDAIDSGKEFKLFRDFAHLKSLMPQDQITQLEAIVPKECGEEKSVSMLDDAAEKSPEQDRSAINNMTQTKGACNRYTLFASAAVVGCAVLSAAFLATP